MRPLPTKPDTTRKPCSAECYKVVPGAAVVPIGHPAMPPAPVERAGSLPKRRGKGRGRHAKRACFGNGATMGTDGCADLAIAKCARTSPSVCLAKRLYFPRLA